MDSHRASEASEPLEGKAATQERILEAAGRLFLDLGYDGATITRIAGAANVSRATVFWHFGDKATLFRESFARLLGPFQVAISRDLSHLQPAKQVRERVALYHAFITQNLEVIRGFIRWAIDVPEFRETIVGTLMGLHRRYEEALTETLGEILPPGHDPGALARAVMAMLDGNLILLVFDPDERRHGQREQGVEAVLDLLPIDASA
ncbi:MAG: TetR/AcrR family transcriptional regulator [Myxococcota bacterium]